MGKKELLDLAFPLAKDVLPKLATKSNSSVLNKFERKISGQGGVRTGKWFTLFIPNQDMDIIIIEITRKIRSINWWRYWNSKRKSYGFLSISIGLALPLMMKVLGKGISEEQK